jgi:hypothetical protein
MSNRELAYKQDMEEWVTGLLGVTEPTVLRQKLSRVIGLYEAKYGGLPGQVIRHIAPPVNPPRGKPPAPNQELGRPGDTHRASEVLSDGSQFPSPAGEEPHP